MGQEQEQERRVVTMQVEVREGTPKVVLVMDARTALELHAAVMWGSRTRFGAAAVTAVRNCLDAVRAAQGSHTARVANEEQVFQGMAGWYAMEPPA